MSTTYLTVVNEILGELNEVRLTQANFSNATNIQQYVKEAVNRAYRDIHDEDYKWPWMVAGPSLDNYYGNVYIETIAGTRWYDLKPIATTTDEQYGHIDWDNFVLTTEGVDGVSTPYTIRNLQHISLEDWRDQFSYRENLDKANTQSYGVPDRVIRHPNGTQFGLSKVPDSVYRIYFFAWNQLTILSEYSDTIIIPSQHLPVLLAKTRVYVWQFKDQMERAQFAYEDYKKGMTRMRESLNFSSPYMKTDHLINA